MSGADLATATFFVGAIGAFVAVFVILYAQVTDKPRLANISRGMIPISFGGIVLSFGVGAIVDRNEGDSFVGPAALIAIGISILAAGVLVAMGKIKSLDKPTDEPWYRRRRSRPPTKPRIR